MVVEYIKIRFFSCKDMIDPLKGFQYNLDNWKIIGPPEFSRLEALCMSIEASSLK